jgi:hypothetical protein
MRIGFRGARIAAALLLAGALVVSAGCQPASETPEEASTAAPTNAEREAEIAAEQLAALGGPADGPTRALYEGEFEASGAIDALGSGEGAWELQLLNDFAQFNRPGLGQDGGLPGDRDYRERGMRVVAGDITITLMAQDCALANGVSLPYVAHVLFEGVAYQGCARRGVAEGVRASWASVLPELIPAIDACLTRVSSRPGRVTTASTLDEGAVSVRIRESDGSRRECIADYAGTAVSVYEPVSDLDRRAGEGDPEFQRSANPPRADTCRNVVEALDAAGGHLGWLVHRSC